ncbi:L,D-transpeptidase [Streptomyces sp. SID5770]|uniref:L,D-transpeptidase n=2 Tax=Streptomyces sp. SID5770 TaxID=2690308 RepID=UPI0031BA0BD1
MSCAAGRSCLLAPVRPGLVGFVPLRRTAAGAVKPKSPPPFAVRRPGSGTPARPVSRLGVEFGPQAGVYGVGQPLAARLDQSVTDWQTRAVVERGLKVASVPSVRGSWHWVDARTLHYRPEAFWPARAVITATSILDGVRISPALTGTGTRPLRITTADRIEAVTDTARHTMTVRRNGHLLRTIPVTTGKPGYLTRKGTKVVLEKEPLVRMKGESIGIPKDSPDAYDLDVHHAIRLTWSGEYVHAAPWSAQHHGKANVSHGCTGMSTDSAAWLYTLLRPGDLIRVTHSKGDTMPPFGNGYGDWNLTWRQWQNGSALTSPPPTRLTPASPRLRPLV